MDTRDGEAPDEGAVEHDGSVADLATEGGDVAADPLDADVTAVMLDAAPAERVAING